MELENHIDFPNFINDYLWVALFHKAPSSMWYNHLKGELRVGGYYRGGKPIGKMIQKTRSSWVDFYPSVRIVEWTFESPVDVEYMVVYGFNTGMVMMHMPIYEKVTGGSTMFLVFDKLVTLGE